AGALAAALDRIMGDAALRMRLGIAARQSATRFASPAIIEQWDRLVDDVRAVAGA
ncbi:glycosyltransferase family 4 protein, partial [Xylella fastidiosa subsp. multiplex]|nr:glycosyltransferase family 4 protein [Xylella fastidiosa subsp. multiplex]